MARTGQKKKSLFKRVNDRVFGRLFCKRSIIVISEHKTQHVPFAVGTQFLTLAAILFVVGWASYSSGSYMAAQEVLVEKDRKLASTTEENERVEAEFTLLKRDLTKLAKEENNGKLTSYAKMMSEQLAKEDNPAGKTLNLAVANDEVNEKYNAVFKRIDFLENKVKELQFVHEEMIADIRGATAGKIREIESVIAATGVDAAPLERQAQAKVNQDEQRREKYGRIQGGKGGQGGPLEPVKGNLLKSKETELYFTIKRMMTLHEIISAMPLAAPLATSNYRQTSGFGRRIDPFRGSLAQHSGVDLAGPVGAEIKATSEGKVTFTGWKGAYGNTVDVEHGFGFSTRYGHLSRVLVKEGQWVKRGELIAVQGSTGRSTGNHLHYEVRYQDKPINPNNFLKAGSNVRALN